MVKHRFTSAVSDSLDTTLVRPINWNDTHKEIYITHRLHSSPTNAGETMNVNSSTYVEAFSLDFYHDWDLFPATHFLITCAANSNAASQSVLLQLTQQASPTNPVSSGGDDLTIPNNGGTQQVLSSGWVAVNDVITGLVLMTLAVKGTNATVDLVSRFVDISFKIA